MKGARGEAWVKEYPCEVLLTGKKISAILSDQVMRLDWRARKAKFSEKADDSVLRDILAMLFSSTEDSIHSPLSWPTSVHFQIPFPTGISEEPQAGIVFYDRDVPLPLDKEAGILAVPISKLWEI